MFMKILLVLFLMSSCFPCFAGNLFLTGNPSDVSPVTSGAICLAGGGSDDEWSAGWKYMLQKANGGDVVIIRADGSRGGYEDWIYKDSDKHDFPKVNSVRTILLKHAADANVPSMVEPIKNAELIFFAGGDQYTYERWLKGSKLGEAIEFAMKHKRVPIGGTSAGMAILGGIDFTAAYPGPTKKEGSEEQLVTGDDVLKDPTAKFVDLRRNFLSPPFLKKVVTETHFSQRHRQPRILGFMARAVYNGYEDLSVVSIKGIAADEGTAFCFDEKGSGKVFGKNSVFFLKGNLPIERIQPGISLHWLGNRKAVSVYEIKGSHSSATFDVSTWIGNGGKEQYWWVDGSNPALPFYGIN